MLKEATIKIIVIRDILTLQQDNKTKKVNWK